MEQLGKYFAPEHYDLALDINKETEIFNGTVVVSGETKSETAQFHAVGLEISQVELDGEAVDFDYSNDVVKITTNPGQKVKIKITFAGKLNHNMQGAYVSTYRHQGETKKIIATQFESHYARECFPCIDEPAAKATFALSITIPGDQDVVLANTDGQRSVRTSPEHPQLRRGRSEETRNDGLDERSGEIWTTFDFRPTPRMSTYLLAFVIGEFNHKSVKNQHGVTVTTYAPLCHDTAMLDFANHTAAAALDYYDDLFGVPYPLEKLDQVAIPDFEAGAMENWGLVTYRESCLLVGPNSPMEAKKSVATVITHELSHQWFGNLVTMQWWNDLWLNESFANVIEYFAADHIYPEYHIWEDFFTTDCIAAFRRDALPGVQAVQQEVHDPAEIATLFDGAIVYAKGAHLMLMLIRIMGEKSFFAGIHDYFEKYKYQNTTADDLWNALQPYANFNVKDFMHAWISQPGYPVITDGKQKRFLCDNTTDDTTWPLPAITDDFSGHYLINLTDQEFVDKIAQFDNLQFEQKLRLLSDRVLLAKTDFVSSASLVDLLASSNLRHETSAAVWHFISMTISQIRFFFDPETPDKRNLQKFLQAFIQPQLNRLGIEPHSNEPQSDTEIRSIILALAYYAEDQETIKQLAQLAQSDLTKIHPEIRDDVIAAKLYLEDQNNQSDYFNFLLEQYQSVTDPELRATLLANLCLAKSPANTARLLELLDQPEIVKPQDHLYLYIYLCRNYKTKPAAFAWLFAHWDYLRDLIGEKSLEDYPRYTARDIRTKAEQNDFFAFFDQFQKDPILARTLTVARTEVAANLALLAADGPAVLTTIAQAVR